MKSIFVSCFLAELLSGASLWMQRVLALLKKRLIVSLRSYFVLAIQLVIPVVCLAGAIALITSTSNSSAEPELTFGMNYLLGGQAKNIRLDFADFRTPGDTSLDIRTGVSHMLSVRN